MKRPSKKKTSPTAAILDDIQSRAGFLATAYRENSEKLKFYVGCVIDFEKWPPEDPRYLWTQEKLADCRKEADIWLALCDKCQEHLNNLARLVAVHMPEIYAALRHVHVEPDEWRMATDNLWDQLATELRVIEAAAIRAATEVADDKPTRRRGRPKLTADDYRERVDFYDLYGLEPTMEKYKRTSRSTISKWRKKAGGE